MKPKAGLVLYPKFDPVLRTKIRKRILSTGDDSMPPGKPLTAEAKRALLDFLNADQGRK